MQDAINQGWYPLGGIGGGGLSAASHVALGGIGKGQPKPPLSRVYSLASPTSSGIYGRPKASLHASYLAIARLPSATGSACEAVTALFDQLVSPAAVMAQRGSSVKDRLPVTENGPSKEEPLS